MSPSAFPYFDWYKSEVTAPILLPQRQSFPCDHFLSQLTTGTTCQDQQCPKETIPSGLMPILWSYSSNWMRCSSMEATLKLCSSKRLKRVRGYSLSELQEWIQRTVGTFSATSQRLKGIFSYVKSLLLTVFSLSWKMGAPKSAVVHLRAWGFSIDSNKLSIITQSSRKKQFPLLGMFFQ